MFIIAVIAQTITGCTAQGGIVPDIGAGVISLPAPGFESEISIEAALLGRRSVRTYQDEPLSLEEVSQLLWAAQGITDGRGRRTAPSAGALYPLEIFFLAGEVSDLPTGVYRYIPRDHSLSLVGEGDRQTALWEGALRQDAVKDAPAVIVIAAVYERTTVKYGDRGVQYVHMEVGCAAQNIYLQAESLGLGTVFIGAFHDDQVKSALGMEADEQPLAVMPVGKK